MVMNGDVNEPLIRELVRLWSRYRGGLTPMGERWVRGAAVRIQEGVSRIEQEERKLKGVRFW